MKIQIENLKGRLRLHWHDGDKRKTLAIDYRWFSKSIDPSKDDRTIKIRSSQTINIHLHWGLGKSQTPAMAVGYIERPVTMLELLSSRGFQSITL